MKCSKSGPENPISVPCLIYSIKVDWIVFSPPFQLLPPLFYFIFPGTPFQLPIRRYDLLVNYDYFLRNRFLVCFELVVIRKSLVCLCFFRRFHPYWAVCQLWVVFQMRLCILISELGRKGALCLLGNAEEAFLVLLGLVLKSLLHFSTEMAVGMVTLI